MPAARIALTRCLRRAVPGWRVSFPVPWLKAEGIRPCPPRSGGPAKPGFRCWRESSGCGGPPPTASWVSFSRSCRAVCCWVRALRIHNQDGRFVRTKVANFPTNTGLVVSSLELLERTVLGLHIRHVDIPEETIADSCVGPSTVRVVSHANPGLEIYLLANLDQAVSV